MILVMIDAIILFILCCEQNALEEFLTVQFSPPFILWDFVHFSHCGILSYGILPCGILSTFTFL